MKRQAATRTHERIFEVKTTIDKCTFRSAPSPPTRAFALLNVDLIYSARRILAVEARGGFLFFLVIRVGEISSKQQSSPQRGQLSASPLSFHVSLGLSLNRRSNHETPRRTERSRFSANCDERTTKNHLCISHLSHNITTVRAGAGLPANAHMQIDR